MISCKAPCKVNVSLRVLGKRADGFHEVDTVMVPLELCDVLEFFPADGLEMSCDAPGVPLDESNLVMKAGRLMERELGRPMPWHVRLVKNVPHGAGLGGGSSDAACVLSALNELEHGGLSRRRLAELAGEIGSDVGFFIYGMACRCTGRGEKVEPLAGMEGMAPPDRSAEAVVRRFHAGRLPPLGGFTGIAGHTVRGAAGGRPCAGE